MMIPMPVKSNNTVKKINPNALLLFAMLLIFSKGKEKEYSVSGFEFSGNKCLE